MKLNYAFQVFGDDSYRGKCLTESEEQQNFIAYVRIQHQNLGRVISHQRNEGLRTYGQAKYQKKEGLTKGAADIIIPARIPFVCEMKRQDHTKSKWQQGQIEYLEECQRLGAFSCVALGCDGAMIALSEWLKLINIGK